MDVTVELPQGEVHQDVQVPVRPNLKRQGAKEAKYPTGTGLSGWQGSNVEGLLGFDLCRQRMVTTASQEATQAVLSWISSD